MKTRLCIAVLSLMVAIGSVAYANSLFYGKTNLYRIEFNQNDLCIAYRSIQYTTAENHQYRAFFAFGVGHFSDLGVGEEYLFTLVSFASPTYNLGKNDSTYVSIQFDNREPQSVYLGVEDRDTFSLYMNYENLEWVKKSHVIHVDMPDNTRLSIPLKGTSMASRYLDTCVKQQFLRRFNYHNPLM